MGLGNWLPVGSSPPLLRLVDMSFGSIADMPLERLNVCFVPLADLGERITDVGFTPKERNSGRGF